jgi:DNA repair protein RecO (recombination protein O)
MNKLRGIVLHSIKYGDTSQIAYLYTDLCGRQTCMFKGVRGAGSRKKCSLIQPLFLLDVEAYPARRQGSMRLAKDFCASLPLQSLPFDLRKNALALFMGEVLYKLIREEEQNEPLFAFLWQHILMLDTLQHGVANFHLYFLAQLARHLGFMPGNTRSDEYPYFDMDNGLFVPFAPSHGAFMDKPTSALLGELLTCSCNSLQHLHLHRHQRSALLSLLLDYYCTHLGMANPIKSLAVLEEVFDG